MSGPRFTIIYDGRCNFCRCSRWMLEKMDWHHRLGFVDLHDEAAMGQFPQISREDAMKSVIVLADDGREQHGYDGIVMLLEAWPFTAPLRWVMRRSMVKWLGRKIYAVVSRNRHRIGWLPTCGSSCAVKH